MKRIATTTAAIFMMTGVAFAGDVAQERVETEKKTHSSSTVTTVDPLESPAVQEQSSSSMKTEKETSSTTTTGPGRQPEAEEQTSHTTRLEQHESSSQVTTE